MCEKPGIGLQQLGCRRRRGSTTDAIIVSSKIAVSATVRDPDTIDFPVCIAVAKSFAVTVAFAVAGAFALAVAFSIWNTLAVGEPEALEYSIGVPIEHARAVAVDGAFTQSNGVAGAISR